MKNFLSLLLAFSLVLSFSSCSFSPKDEPSSEASSSTEPETLNPPAYKDVLTLGPAAKSEPVLLDPSVKCHAYYMVESNGSIVTCSKEGDISVFSAETGACLYETSSPGFLIRVDKYTEKPGYDYRLIMGDRIVYRSTEDGDKKFTELLPNGLVFNRYFTDVASVYDMNEESFVWAADEGIMLFDKAGETSKLLIPNPTLSEAAEILDHDVSYYQENGFSFLYKDPRFILGGTKLAVGVMSSEGIYHGIIVYNLASNVIELGHFIYEPDVPNFPLSDRYIETASYLLDASTAKAIKKSDFFPSFPGFDIADGKTAYYSTTGKEGHGHQDDYTNLHIYTAQLSEPENGFRPFISLVNPSIESSFSVLDGYFLISIESACYLVKY